MKKRLFSMLGMLLLIFVTACSGASNPGSGDSAAQAAGNDGSAKKVIIAEPNHQLGYLPVYVALNEGFFQEEGLDVELLMTGGGQHVNAVLTGNAHAFVGGPEWNAFALERDGGKEKVIKAVSGVTHRGNVYLVGKPNTTLPTDPEQLKQLFKGKTIVVGVNGSTTNSIPRYYLKSIGLDPDKDVTLVAVETGNIISTFKSMNADFAAGVEPNLSEGIEQGIYGQPLVNFPKQWGEYAYSTLNVSEKLINSDPEMVQKLVNGVAKGLDLIQSDPDKAREIAKKEFSTMDPRALELSVNRFLEDQLWEGAKWISKDAFEISMKIVVEAGKLKEVPAYESLVETKFMKK